VLSPALRWLRRGVVVLLVFVVLDYLALPQIAGARNALHLLGDIRPWWVIIGVALEVLSLVSYSMLTRSVLPDIRPPFSWVIRTDLTALGVSHLVPGGAATASTLRYRLFREGGTPAEDAAVGMAVEGVGSSLVLIAMLWFALVVSIPLVGVSPLYLAVAVIGALLIAAVLLAVFARSRETTPTAPDRGLLQAVIRRLPHRVRPRIERAVQDASHQLHQLLADKQALRSSATWAAASWALDAASLWVFLAAYGVRVNPDGLLVAYGLANVVAIVPISPGGLGVIEGVLIPSLVGFGTPRGVAVLGVVSWRLFNFWAPIPTAGACYLSLRTQNWRDRRRIPDPAGGPSG
jgi:uncharacterized protein (TIRG00374 family)